MALVTLSSPALMTSAIIILLITSYFYYLKFSNGHNSSNRHTSQGKTQRHAHLLIVLGSGGHTAEMLAMLEHAPLDANLFTYRTYVVSSGDSFSVLKSVEFEKRLLEQQQRSLPTTAAAATTSRKGEPSQPQPTTRRTSDLQEAKDDERKHLDSSALKALSESPPSSYTIITVPRARRVHQSFLTAPISTLHCLWVCICVLRGKHRDPKNNNEMPPSLSTSAASSTPTGPPTPIPYPNIILTNGPATAVCVILAAKMLRAVTSISTFLFIFFQNQSSQQLQPSSSHHRERYLRTIFIESWARVTTLSLSGKIVLPLVDRFLVQWEGLEGYSSWFGGTAEFVGALVV
ncbi:hypothetical protein RJZ56_006829 [Blastomyces dermatitidis]|uniref:UDP-N-acetylglucosamine transferase subunit ALG14 n=2 Tax=Blastomyces TaxID=229219 RepID=A0A179UEA0_BLAGS|nr:glycosyltransferase, variant [Blastomyces gilchristii SLH14081]XP_031577165.1 glycosyltransferase [Blastomyces gilchristii SLH14081]EGE85557.1 glycosyltransferase [Blastomyces dermatitidis ATCC 18188]EQL28553.1 hypothetical protein BDFG_08707 [Blastomyces dermatitidis ATCC 26199]EQL28554.1 hypothetical protein, variant [Blastomyces dermatitidis ATCC 26199]KMW68667.1 glycosyltransferase, variant [Blastomyces dermatitidis ATCC 18188]OAT06346.1 glycosyltransferase [Blastomyces gilchristii SLH